MAIKWLGNTATHGDIVSRDELITGFELLELSLEDLYDNRRERLDSAQKQLTKKHGG